MLESAPIWVTMATAGLALGGVVFTALVGRRSQANQKRIDEVLAINKANADRELARLNATLQADRDALTAQREGAKIIAKFRNPLMHAAYDMQSRIFNILRLHFLQRYYSNGSAREQDYAVENTVFLLAQFLGWTEIIRQEIQFLALDDDDQTKRLRQLQDGIYTQLQTDRFGEGFRLFAGEQRAVGELMIDRGTGTPRCLGFAAFLTGRNAAIDRWLDPLRDDVRQMAIDVAPFQARLTAFQHSLIDLLQFLDPEDIWFPRSSRDKICAS
jgi:hypothetical protein